MPDDDPYADDISDLWAPEQQGALEHLRPALRAGHRNPPDPAAVNGSGRHAGGAESHDELAELAEAIAALQICAASRAELDAVCERITAVRDDVRALHDAVTELKNTVDRQGRRLQARPRSRGRSHRF